MTLFAASNEHQWRHQDSTAPDARCTLRPCRALAAAEALGHCITYRSALTEFRRELGFASVGEWFLITVERYKHKWLEARQDRGLSDVKTERGRLAHLSPEFLS